MPTEPGVRVHPTPVYEMIMYLAIFFILWRMRRLERPPWWLFGLFLILAGAERFAVEFVRRNDKLWLGLTEAQLVSVAAALAGAALMIYAGARRKKGAA